MNDEPSTAAGPDAEENAAPAAPALLGEDSFRRVVEWAPSAIVIVDRKGFIVQVNAQTERMFNYPRQALVGRSVEVLVPERLRVDHCGFRAGYAVDPQPRPMGVGRELAGCRADGSEFPIEIGLNPIATEHGVMVLASIIDITERRRAQQNLEDALREKTVLLNEVHHRVKNNLQVITSLLKLQSDYAPDAGSRAVLSESCERVKAMALTHQMLYEHKDFSRLDLGDYLDRLVQSIRSSYRASGDRIGLRTVRPETDVRLDLERAIPCGLLVNELVTNAFKHAFKDERRGEIVVEVREEADDQIFLGVGDDGVGLPPGIDAAQDTTLGLQLVRLFIEQLHGSLSIDRGQGTRFAIRFPKRSAAKEASWAQDSRST